MAWCGGPHTKWHAFVACACRLGQARTVSVYRLVVKGTVDESIHVSEGTPARAGTCTCMVVVVFLCSL